MKRFSILIAVCFLALSTQMRAQSQIPYAKLTTTVPSNGTNAVQTITIGGSPTTGGFTPKWNGRAGSAVVWSGTNATLLAHLATSLDGLFGAGNTVATAGTLSSGVGTILVTFQAAYGKEPIAAVISFISNTMDGSGTVAAATTTTGILASYRGAVPGAMLIYTGVTPPGYYTNISTTAAAPNWTILGNMRVVSLGTPALGTVTYVHANITQPTSGTTSVTTALTNPDVPRNATITGNQATCTGNVVIWGKDGNSALLQDTIAASGTSTVAGTKAFSTVDSVWIPTRGAASDALSIGTGTKLGIGVKLTLDAVWAGYLGGTREATRPTVAVNPTYIYLNTAAFSTAYDGSKAAKLVLTDGF